MVSGIPAEGGGVYFTLIWPTPLFSSLTLVTGAGVPAGEHDSQGRCQGS